MGWLDDVLSVGGAIAGGVGGFFAGGPGGALAGASLGASGGHFLGSRLDSGDDAADAQAKKLADIYASLNYQDPANNPAYQKELAQLQQYSTGALTPEDKARELEALTQAGQFAKGQTGAIEQDAATKGSGVANAGMTGVNKAVAAQGAAGRLASADVQTAGMASARGVQANQEFLRQMQVNSEMQNQFAMAKAGGVSANTNAYLQYLGAKQAADRSALDNFVGTLGKAGATYAFGKGMPGSTPPPTAGVPDLSLGSTALTKDIPSDSSGFGGFSSSLRLPNGDGSPASLASLFSPTPVEEAPQGQAPSFESSTEDPYKRKRGP